MVTAADLLTLDYAFGGEPFCNIPTKSTINTKTMDYAFVGVPFVTNDQSSGPTNPTSILKVTSASQAAIKSVSTITLSAIKLVAGVSNVS